jgi:hypothetical protein
MRKFVVHTRALPGHKFTGVPTVLEVEGGAIKAVEDPSVMWLPEGEFKFRITAPEVLYEPKEVAQPEGPPKNEMVPPVYHSHAVYWTVHQAMVHAEKMVKANFEFELRKGKRESFTDQELKERLAEIQTIMLP